MPNKGKTPNKGGTLDKSVKPDKGKSAAHPMGPVESKEIPSLKELLGSDDEWELEPIECWVLRAVENNGAEYRPAHRGCLIQPTTDTTSGIVEVKFDDGTVQHASTLCCTMEASKEGTRLSVDDLRKMKLTVRGLQRGKVAILLSESIFESIKEEESNLKKKRPVPCPPVEISTEGGTCSKSSRGSGNPSPASKKAIYIMLKQFYLQLVNKAKLDNIRRSCVMEYAFHLCTTKVVEMRCLFMSVRHIFLKEARSISGDWEERDKDVTDDEWKEIRSTLMEPCFELLYASDMTGIPEPPPCFKLGKVPLPEESRGKGGGAGPSKPPRKLGFEDEDLDPMDLVDNTMDAEDISRLKSEVESRAEALTTMDESLRSAGLMDAGIATDAKGKAKVEVAEMATFMAELGRRAGAAAGFIADEGNPLGPLKFYKIKDYLSYSVLTGKKTGVGTDKYVMEMENGRPFFRLKDEHAVSSALSSLGVYEYAKACESIRVVHIKDLTNKGKGYGQSSYQLKFNTEYLYFVDKMQQYVKVYGMSCVLEMDNLIREAVAHRYQSFSWIADFDHIVMMVAHADLTKNALVHSSPNIGAGGDGRNPGGGGRNPGGGDRGRNRLNNDTTGPKKFTVGPNGKIRANKAMIRHLDKEDICLFYNTIGCRFSKDDCRKKHVSGGQGAACKDKT